MFENLIGKTVKVVWKDLNANGENKAVFGLLKDISDDFICVLQDSNPIYLNISSIVTIKEHIKNG